MRAKSRALHQNPALLALSLLLLLRSRVFTLPKDALVRLRAVASGKQPMNPEELLQALQQLFVKDGDGGKSILLPHKNGISKVPIRPIPDKVLDENARHFPSPPESSKPNLDKSFLRQLKAILLYIAFPKFRSKEMATLITHSCFLVLRTILSVWVARLDGRIVRDLISADGKGFLRGLGLWFLLAIPSTYTNSMIRHLQSKLSLQLRSNLTRYIHDLYFSSELRYYRNGLEGVDQYITADVEAWAESISGLYGNILKPSLDIVLFTSQLSRSLGVRGTILLFANYYATVSILRAVTPAFGRLAAVEAKLEGEYRAGMARVSKEGEEVAFYDGGGRERDILTKAYMRLIKHINSIYKIRIAYEWTEDFVIKYLWSAAGYMLIAVPFLFTRKKRAVGTQTGADKPRDAVADRTETYISNRRLLLSLADAGGRLMYAYKDILELAGLTTRLYTLISSLYNLPPRAMTGSSDSFEVNDVNIVIPDADAHVLVKDLSLHVQEGDHLMITGSNGVGKTAVARVLAGLWSSSTPLNRPSGQNVFVVPQRAYMVTGSLLSQIIYPDAYPDFVAKGKTVDDLMKILEAVNLAYLPEREGGWETIKEWRDVLSGGEKQRMGMARVFYHLPKYAILDECTSAVSSDVEGRMYEHAKSLGITLITISLRPSLMKYHTHLLTLSGDGNGSWTLSKMGTKEERMGIDREIASLEAKLEDVDKWQARLDELNGLLSVQEPVDS